MSASKRMRGAESNQENREIECVVSRVLAAATTDELLQLRVAAGPAPRPQRVYTNFNTAPPEGRQRLVDLALEQITGKMDTHLPANATRRVVVRRRYDIHRALRRAAGDCNFIEVALADVSPLDSAIEQLSAQDKQTLQRIAELQAAAAPLLEAIETLVAQHEQTLQRIVELEAMRP